MRALERGLPRIDVYTPAARRRAAERLTEENRRLREEIKRQQAEIERLRAEIEKLKEERRTSAAEIARLGGEATKAALAAPHLRPARQILADIVAQHGYPVGVILGPGRADAIVKVRDAAIAAVHRARPDLSLPQLGLIFGRDHTSILHSLKKTGAYLGGWRNKGAA